MRGHSNGYLTSLHSLSGSSWQTLRQLRRRTCIDHTNLSGDNCDVGARDETVHTARQSSNASQSPHVLVEALPCHSACDFTQYLLLGWVWGRMIINARFEALRVSNARKIWNLSWSGDNINTSKSVPDHKISITNLSLPSLLLYSSKLSI